MVEASFIPKFREEDEWTKIEPHKKYAVLCSEENFPHIRLGAGKSLYLGFSLAKPDGRLLSDINYESGSETLLYKLSQKVTVRIGRTPECTIKIMQAIVSRQHLEITLENNILVVTDLGSSNGTYFHNDSLYFEIDGYLASHPLDKAAESTLDAVHEAFGPTLDDFLKRYSEEKDKKV